MSKKIQIPDEHKKMRKENCISNLPQNMGKLIGSPFPSYLVDIKRNIGQGFPQNTAQLRIRMHNIIAGNLPENIFVILFRI